MESMGKIANLSSLSITNALVQRISIGFNRYTFCFRTEIKLRFSLFYRWLLKKKTQKYFRLDSKSKEEKSAIHFHNIEKESDVPSVT